MVMVKAGALHSCSRKMNNTDVSIISRFRPVRHNPAMSLEFDALRRFLESQMRMSHIYQPLMLRTILQVVARQRRDRSLQRFSQRTRVSSNTTRPLRTGCMGRCCAGTALWSGTAAVTVSLPEWSACRRQRLTPLSPCLMRRSRSSKQVEGQRSGSIGQSPSVRFRASSDTRR